VLDRTAGSAPELRAWRALPRLRDVLLNLAVAATYWIVAELTLLPATPEGRVTPMWPAAGVAVAAVLLGGTRLLPGIAAGSLLLTTPRSPLPAAFAIAMGAALEAVIDVSVLRRLRFDERMERVRDPFVLALAALTGSAVSAAVGTTALRLTGTLAADELRYQFILWWMRNCLGVQIVVALIVTWARGRPIVWTWPRVFEGLALAVGVLLMSQLLFGMWAIYPGHNVPLTFLFFPAIGYAGLRFGPAGAATGVAVLAIFTLPIAAFGVGPFAAFPIALTQFLLHLFLSLGSLTGQTLAAVMAEREDALQRRLALEEQLLHSQKMEAVGRLAGGIAHDFNNLLTAIIGYAELVMTGLERNDPRRADAEEITRAAMRASDLTRQMLAFSRRQLLQPQVIDLNVTVSKVEPMLRRVIGEDIGMTIAPKAANAQVRVDPGQIEHVIMNLVVNARDAMPHGGRLTVETSDVVLDATDVPADMPPGPYAVLSVSDSGIGMSAEVRARIFEPYFTTKEVGKGTGLGLSTVYGIVRQSGGYIEVFSEPGLGSTFKIYLPRTKPEASSAIATVEEQLPTGTEHILVVEDDVSVRRLSREILERLGYSVTEAASGRAGLALGTDETRHFDVALCDVILGDMNGPAVYEALRALRPSVRVLYMSGYADEAIVRTGVLEQGYPFLPKPFRPHDLARKVREVLDAEAQ